MVQPAKALHFDKNQGTCSEQHDENAVSNAMETFVSGALETHDTHPPPNV